MNLEEYNKRDKQRRDDLLRRTANVLNVDRVTIATQTLFDTIEMLVTKLENKGETE